MAPLRDGRIRSEGRQAADFIEFLSLSGCRVAEASELTWNRVYLEGDEHPEGQYMLVRGKADQEIEYKERKVPLFPPLLKLLRRMHAEAKDLTGKVFPARSGGDYYPRRPLESALKVSGIAEERWFQFHGLRHYFATECVMRSVPVGIVAQWLGHSDGGELVVKRYGNHISDDQVRHFVDRVDFQRPIGSA